MPNIGITNNSSTEDEEVVIDEPDEHEGQVYSPHMQEWIDEDAAVDTSFGIVSENYNSENLAFCDHCRTDVLTEDFNFEYDACHACVDRLGLDREDEDDYDDDDDYTPSFSTRQANLGSVSHQDTEKGAFIKSQRKFGVELEVIAPSDALGKLQQSISRDYGMVTDGSVHGDNSGESGIEVVTPILQGKRGEQSLIDTIKKMNELKYTVNASCGLHVHLDGSDLNPVSAKLELQVMSFKEFRKSLETTNYSRKRVDVFTKESLGIINCVHKGNPIGSGYDAPFGSVGEYGPAKRKELTTYIMTKLVPWIEGNKNSILGANAVVKRNTKQDHIINTRGNGDDNYDRFVTINDVYVLDSNDASAYRRRVEKIQREYQQGLLSIDEMTRLLSDITVYRHDFNDDDWVIVQDAVSNDKLDKVKRVMMFYSAFTDVIHAMLPKSRRTNRFCQSLADKVNYQRVQRINTVDDLLRMWYETDSVLDAKNRSGSKYDNSRYYGVNFHSLFKNGTVEIRYHSGTCNRNRVLLWVNIHQTILDRISEGKISWEDIQRVNECVFLQDKLDLFFELAKFSKKVQEYIVKRIETFNDEKIRKVKKTKGNSMTEAEATI